MNHQNKPLEELIEITKNNLDKHFVLDDGRIVFNGRVFKNEEQLKRYFKSSKKVFNFTNTIRRLFGLKPL